MALKINIYGCRWEVLQTACVPGKNGPEWSLLCRAIDGARQGRLMGVTVRVLDQQGASEWDIPADDMSVDPIEIGFKP